MQFEATRKYGNRTITRIIKASNLKQAEKIANKTYKHWEEIRVKNTHRDIIFGDYADVMV